MVDNYNMNVDKILAFVNNIYKMYKNRIDN